MTDQRAAPGPTLPDDGRASVVGVAIVEDRRLLAARRTAPAAAAGRWELPGGKVEPGESVAAAAAREVMEELSCRVSVERVLDLRVPIGASHALVVAVASLVDGEPVPHEHDAIRWLAGSELEVVDWLEPDLPFLPLLRGVL